MIDCCTCADDGILWQEIFSLREKLKIAVAAIKSYDPDFDDMEFTHRINSVDYDQLMEELSDTDTRIPTPPPPDILMDARQEKLHVDLPGRRTVYAGSNELLKQRGVTYKVNMDDCPTCAEPVVDFERKDWTEDFGQENGNYQNRCIECNDIFYGHKRRDICKECAESVDGAPGAACCGQYREENKK